MSGTEAKELAAQIAEMLAAKQIEAGNPRGGGWAAPAQAGWNAPAAVEPAPLTPTGVMFRIKVPLPDGSEVPGYIQFGPECVTDMQTLQAAVAQIAQLMPIDRYQPRNNFQGGGGGWQGGGGGYQNGGGYNGGGYGRRWHGGGGGWRGGNYGGGGWRRY